MTSARPRFAHGVALAAAVPYATCMILLLTSLDGLGPEELAFRKFVATVIGFVGVPLSILLAALVFGIGRAVLQRVRLSGPWPYAAWGLLSALFLVVVLLLLPPSRSPSGELPSALLASLVGAVAGAAFWVGAVREPGP